LHVLGGGLIYLGGVRHYAGMALNLVMFHNPHGSAYDSKEEEGSELWGYFHWTCPKGSAILMTKTINKKLASQT